jgi:hydrogenase expression/formation protein HypC
MHDGRSALAPLVQFVPFLGTALQTYNLRNEEDFGQLGVRGKLIMCLAYPGKVVRIDGEFAAVDYGPDGIRENINVSLVDVQVGNYVLVQGGFAIRVLSGKEAEESLDAWRMIMELEEAEAETARS